MTKTKIYRRLLALVLMLIFTSSVAATPRVVVSIPFLYSLVSSLMEGAGEPVLLLGQDIDHSVNMNSFQKSQLITADMLIWVGPGLETPIAKTLNQLPMLDSNRITLSNHLPLLPRIDSSGAAVSRQGSRDLNFWTDPRLAVMAVRMITPQLVRLDPEHQDLYLDNEIALIKKLKTLEQDIAAMLTPFSYRPHDYLAGVDRYFSHRFLPTTRSGVHGSGSLRKVSTGVSTTCADLKKLHKNITPSPSLYFDSMRLKAQSFYACLNKSQKQASASRQHKINNHKI